jgi:hypothetical protein
MYIYPFYCIVACCRVIFLKCVGWHVGMYICVMPCHSHTIPLRTQSMVAYIPNIEDCIPCLQKTCRPSCVWHGTYLSSKKKNKLLASKFSREVFILGSIIIDIEKQNQKQKHKFTQTDRLIYTIFIHSFIHLFKISIICS